MKSSDGRCQTHSRHQDDNFVQSLPDMTQFSSSINIISSNASFMNINPNTVNVVETDQRVEELSPVSCQNDETLPSSEPVSHVCCEWIQNTTKHEKLILFCLFLVDLTSQMCLSIMAPFFPQEVTAFAFFEHSYLIN